MRRVSLAILIAVALVNFGCELGGEGDETIGDQVTPDIPDVWSFDGAGTDISNPVALNGEYRLMAWNDLGMHCLNPTYDQMVILPPYNTVWAQLVRLGNPPEIITENVILEYKVLDNTYSSGKTDSFGGDYAQFWTHVEAIFGVALEQDTGLNLVDAELHNGLSGTMVLSGDHFQVDGIPAVPVDDSGVWNPYQRIQVVARDTAGNVLATNVAALPTSDEISCGKCHGDNPFADILTRHSGADLTGMEPVLCASCHGSPVLGTQGAGSSGRYLSDAIHSFHADKNASCYDCHPGEQTKCSRSLAHTGPDGNCTECHGTMGEVGGSVGAGTRIPWVDEPKCSTCHEGVHGVDTGSELYRNSAGHGGLACAACHGSPHAMVPSREAVDNVPFEALQGSGRSLGSCAVCHKSSRGPSGEFEEFNEEHGGSNPEHKNACHTCHTTVTSDTTGWPHKFQWKSHSGNSTVED